MRARTFITETGLEIDSGDAWGSVMGILFGMGDALTHADEDVPPGWDYRHSPVCNDVDPDEYDAISIIETVNAGDVTWDDVRHAGDVLIRYSHMLERAGRSY